jgi:hypothetical protein
MNRYAAGTKIRITRLNGSVRNVRAIIAAGPLAEWQAGYLVCLAYFPEVRSMDQRIIMPESYICLAEDDVICLPFNDGDSVVYKGRNGRVVSSGSGCYRIALGDASVRPNVPPPPVVTVPYESPYLDYPE